MELILSRAATWPSAATWTAEHETWLPFLGMSRIRMDERARAKVTRTVMIFRGTWGRSGGQIRWRRRAVGGLEHRPQLLAAGTRWNFSFRLDTLK